MEFYSTHCRRKKICDKIERECEINRTDLSLHIVVSVKGIETEIKAIVLSTHYSWRQNKTTHFYSEWRANIFEIDYRRQTISLMKNTCKWNTSVSIFIQIASRLYSELKRVKNRNDQANDRLSSCVSHVQIMLNWWEQTFN